MIPEGREIPRCEHNIPGRVYVARPMTSNVVLPPELQQKQDEFFERIRAIKAEAYSRMTEVAAETGNILVADSLDVDE
jgi:hypothetical protein